MFLNRLKCSNLFKQYKISSHFNFSEKLYKVTFSGLDKFLSNDELKNILHNLNELKIHRTNKSTNKNFAHVDISSNLNIDNLKKKFEGVKIMGKSVKVRVKELDEETKEIFYKNNNNLDLNLLNNDDLENSKILIRNIIRMFYIKNLSDNPTHIKNVLDQIDKSEDWIIINEINREIFDFEYKLQILKDFNSQKMSSKDYFENPTFIHIKNYSEFENDSKYSKQNLIIKNVFEKLEEIFMKLGYPSYDNDTNKGVFRNLQIKFLNSDSNSSEDKYIFTLMLSMSQLSQNDFKIICEALNYEFRNEINNFSFYLSINEKVQEFVNTSSSFYHVFGNFKNLNLKSPNKYYEEIKIFPFNFDHFPIYFKNLDLIKLFEKNSFDNIIELDFSRNFTPIHSTLNISNFNKCFYLKYKYDYRLFDMNSQINLLENNSENNENINLKIKEEYLLENKLKYVGKVDEIEIDNSSIKDNLMIINLRSFSNKKIKLEEVLKKSKHHIIISHSLLQILDFLKNYSVYPKVKKIIFMKDLKYEIKDVIIILEI